MDSATKKIVRDLNSTYFYMVREIAFRNPGEAKAILGLPADFIDALIIASPSKIIRLLDTMNNIAFTPRGSNILWTTLINVLENDSDQHNMQNIKDFATASMSTTHDKKQSTRR